MPHDLVELLAHPRITKVGRQVSSDLTALRRSCSSDRPFVGALDLVKYARDRCVLESRLASSSIALNDLCALIMGKCLQKNIPERTSNEWENQPLSDAQTSYAARDAWASLTIYSRLSAIPPPSPLAPEPAALPPAGTPVLVYGSDNSLIARGQIMQLGSETVDHEIPTRSQVVVGIRQVLIPGAILTSHRRQPLSTFGEPPFNVVVARSGLRVYTPIVLPNIERQPNPESTSPSPPPPSDPNFQPPDDANDDENEMLGATPREANEGPSLSDLIFDTVDISVDESTLFGEVDEAALAEGLAILGAVPTEWEDRIYSRVIKDAFHVFHMFYISASHGLRLAFARALRDAIFLLDPDDVARITHWAQSLEKPLTFEELWTYHTRWVLRHCKRIIPPPPQLYPAVATVFKKFGALKDATTGAPLFNHEAWRVAKQVLKLIYDGYLSDPPGVTLYLDMGAGSKTGLTVYRCCRGTNATEGGVHTHLRSHLPATGTSIEHAQATLTDYSLCHNLNVSCNQFWASFL